MPKVRDKHAGADPGTGFMKAPQKLQDAVTAAQRGMSNLTAEGARIKRILGERGSNLAAPVDNGGGVGTFGDGQNIGSAASARIPAVRETRTNLNSPAAPMEPMNQS